MNLSTWILVSPIFSTAFASEPVKVCQLGDARSYVVTVVRDARIASTHIYYLEHNGKRSPLFGTPEQSRGSAVEVACVGNKRRGLVLSGEFSANALQGFAISYSPATNRLERLDFAEKSRPAWLYLAPDEMIVVVNTLGYGEINTKYVAYRHQAGNAGEAMVEGIDQLPTAAGFEVVHLRPWAKHH
jgi:hypothetical protein